MSSTTLTPGQGLFLRSGSRTTGNFTTRSGSYPTVQRDSLGDIGQHEMIKLSPSSGPGREASIHVAGSGFEQVLFTMRLSVRWTDCDI
jgi:hypothetical protein